MKKTVKNTKKGAIESILDTLNSIKSAMVTKKEHQTVLESVKFIKDRMVTKSELAEVRTELKKDIEDTRLELRSKIDGGHGRIDEDLDKRKTLENRMSRIEARA